LTHPIRGNIFVVYFMKAAFIALVCLPLIAQAPYQTSISASDVAIELPANSGAAALWQSLKRLHTRASLIMITAHPDDEDGGMLTYESRGQGARVALLTLNRGEGGANVMSSDYFDALGLVRTEELLAADRYYGVDQYWTRVVDYGFSKTMDESLSKWTRDRVLYDVVRVVRMVRPLVITSVFVGGPSDGHGNHQTAGLMAKEVYRLAGDPTVFPEQIKAGLKPWTPLKDYARVPFSRRGNTSQLAPNLEIPEGIYDPSLGLNYLQVSREGLGHQKSQNGGTAIPAAGPTPSAYHRFDSRVAAADKEQSFFDGIDTSLPGIASLAKQRDAAFLLDGLKQINADVERALDQFSAAQPDKVAPFLADGLKGTIALLDRLSRSSLSEDAKYDVAHELNIKRAQFNDSLAEALGIAVRATVAPATEPDPRTAMFAGEPDTFRIAIPGQTFGVKVQIVNQSSVPVSLRRVSLKPVEAKWWSISDTKAATGDLTPNQLTTATFRATVAADAGYTRPYYSRPSIEQPYYDILDERYLNLPRSPYPLAASVEITYNGVPIEIAQVVQTVKRMTGSGQVLEPLVVGPAISVAISPRAGIVPLESKSFPLTAVVHSNVKGPAKGSLKLELPAGWRSTPESVGFSAAQEGEDHSVAFQITPGKLAEKSYKITAVANYSGKTYREGYQVTGYNGLRPYFLYTSSTYRTTGVDVKVAPGLNVGYIMGSGDDVPASLEHIGIKVSFLTAADLAGGDLSKFDVIILGVRTYAVRDDLRTYNNRLLDYTRNGGAVIVEYNTPEYDHNYGPYPYVMGNNPEEVTDEASKVDILAPANPVFNWPNKITEDDFRGWAEERGSKWMQSWDSHYEALLSTHDPDQAPQKGGLLYAKYGKGIYIYNAYAFYRQLPEGVPGAYRIFANMVSLPKNPAR
jgi:LmbE family N-acetylglucosaminyl deacetylase